MPKDHWTLDLVKVTLSIMLVLSVLIGGYYWFVVRRSQVSTFCRGEVWNVRDDKARNDAFMDCLNENGITS